MKNVRQVVPYTPGAQPKETNIIKLNTNENPYEPSPLVMAQAGKLHHLKLYPDPMVTPLVAELARYHELKEDQVFVGVGSDDVLAVAFMTFFNSDLPIVFPDITYSFYDVWAQLFKVAYNRAPLDESFCIVKEDYYEPNGGVIFPNPNAPTGQAVSLEFIEDIMDHNQDVVVIIDEAYVDFGATSAGTLVDKYENLLVVQTFSKSRSLAGLRVGYAMGNAALIKAMNNVKHSFNSYTMNAPSIELGVASLKDDIYFKNTVAKIVQTRERFAKELIRLGFTFQESKANFIFATHKTVAAKDIFKAAGEYGIYVRYFDKPRINNYLRITIGTDDEMKAVVEFLDRYLGK